MNTKIIILILSVLIFSFCTGIGEDISMNNNTNNSINDNDKNNDEKDYDNSEIYERIPYLENIKWLKSSHQYGGACIRIIDDLVIYIDPAHISDEHTNIKADIILITHSHDDHFHIPTLEKILKPETIIMSVKECIEKLSEYNNELNLKEVTINDSIEIQDIKIDVMPAYSSSAHLKENGWVGFLISISDKRIYHTGDSDYIDEMKTLTDLDFVFVTVRNPYMMGHDDVINFAKDVKPKVLIPIHWIESEREIIQYIVDNTPPETEIILLKAE